MNEIEREVMKGQEILELDTEGSAIRNKVPEEC